MMSFVALYAQIVLFLQKLAEKYKKLNNFYRKFVIFFYRIHFVKLKSFLKSVCTNKVTFIWFLNIFISSRLIVLK